MQTVILAATVVIGFCVLPALASSTDFGPNNPFFAPSTLPFQAPPFDKIKDEDYQPAMEAGMAEELKEVQAIANNPAPPTFENTIVAMEKSGQLLQRVRSGFLRGDRRQHQSHAAEGTSPSRRRSSRPIATPSSSTRICFSASPPSISNVSRLKLDPESLRLVEYDYDQFVHAGANLSEADKTELKKLNEELATLSNTFTTKLLAATKDGAYVTTDKAALAGLSDAQISAAAEAAKGRKVEGFVLPLQNTTQQPDLVALSNRSTRQALFANSWNRAERGDANDTRDTIAKIAQLRAQKGKLLGFPNFAAWKIEDQMAKTPEAALKFMDALVPAATARAASEAQDIQAVIDQQKGGFKVQPWDWDFYSEQVRKAKYDLDEEQVKPYFELNNVLRTASSTPPTSSTGSPSKSAKIFRCTTPSMRVFEVFQRRRQFAGAVLLRLLQARQQAGRRLDEQLCRPVQAAGHQAGRRQRRQFRHARARASPRCSPPTM